ncbi:hypothetical protein SAMN02745132_02279 [Enterovibrio nigricans DSM 22720]|uniref:Uncharacterized protein n=1 Tax=Enterovibrio nigricans DSM 22720 TaxID=1121868 RepID=A0A1T4UR09_9GAMM|nr:hypothetical protein SAMN02745132_02279 [Enterovibrio nigricans DSM 22720]
MRVISAYAMSFFLVVETLTVPPPFLSFPFVFNLVFAMVLFLVNHCHRSGEIFCIALGQTRFRRVSLLYLIDTWSTYGKRVYHNALKQAITSRCRAPDGAFSFLAIYLALLQRKDTRAAKPPSHQVFALVQKPSCEVR